MIMIATTTTKMHGKKEEERPWREEEKEEEGLFYAHHCGDGGGGGGGRSRGAKRKKENTPLFFLLPSSVPCKRRSFLNAIFGIQPLLLLFAYNGPFQVGGMDFSSSSVPHACLAVDEGAGKRGGIKIAATGFSKWGRALSSQSPPFIPLLLWPSRVKLTISQGEGEETAEQPEQKNIRSRNEKFPGIFLLWGAQRYISTFFFPPFLCSALTYRGEGKRKRRGRRGEEKSISTRAKGKRKKIFEEDFP